MTLFQYDDSSKLYREGDIVDYLIEIFVETLTEFGAVFFYYLNEIERCIQL